MGLLVCASRAASLHVSHLLLITSEGEVGPLAQKAMIASGMSASAASSASLMSLLFFHLSIAACACRLDSAASSWSDERERPPNGWKSSPGIASPLSVCITSLNIDVLMGLSRVAADVAAGGSRGLHYLGCLGWYRQST